MMEMTWAQVLCRIDGYTLNVLKVRLSMHDKGYWDTHDHCIHPTKLRRASQCVQSPIQDNLSEFSSLHIEDVILAPVDRSDPLFTSIVPYYRKANLRLLHRQRKLYKLRKATSVDLRSQRHTRHLLVQQLTAVATM